MNRATDEQTVKQARSLISQQDFDGGIDLLSPIDDPTPDGAFALAESYFLKATSINHFSAIQRTHTAFPDLLACTALLALTQGDDREATRCVGFSLRRPSSGRLRPTEAGRATPSLRPHSATEAATLSL